MGCSSEGVQSQPASKNKKYQKKGLIKETVTWEYFQGFGRGDPLTQMFEYHGQTHKKNNLDFEGWEKRKAAGDGGEFGGGLPQVYITEKG